MPAEIVGRVLRLVGYTAYQWTFQEASSELTIWVRQAASRPFYTCSRCGVGCEGVHSVRERRVRDLLWGSWKVFLVVEAHRVYCRRCGVCAERIEFLEGKHPYTQRFAAAVARDCEDAAVRRVAAKWGLSAQTVRRIDKRSLVAWAKLDGDPVWLHTIQLVVGRGLVEASEAKVAVWKAARCAPSFLNSCNDRGYSGRTAPDAIPWGLWGQPDKQNPAIHALASLVAPIDRHFRQERVRRLSSLSRTRGCCDYPGPGLASDRVCDQSTGSRVILPACSAWRRASRKLAS